MSAVRLQKLIADAGVASRRAAEALIREGRVRVDGRIAVIGQRADPETQRVTVDGAPLPEARSKRTLMLHKPAGVVVTRHDERGRRTVYDLLGGDTQSLRYAGRLDRDSSGLLLMTTDGQLQHRVAHPRYELVKVYEVTLDNALPTQAVGALRAGVTLSDGPTSAARVERLAPAAGRPRLEVAIHEGRNRQVRRMIEAVGGRVERLHRSAVGPLRLDGLPNGKARDLSFKEQRLLWAAVGLEGSAR